MKKNLLILLSILVLSACADEKKSVPGSVSGGENVEQQPAETKITVTGVKSSYNLSIMNSNSTTTHPVSFTLHNKTANDYNNIKLTPVLKENGVEITETDGFTAALSFTETNMISNSDALTTINIKYTGSVKENLDLSLKITSDNLPEEEISIGKVNFYTYLQAFYFDGTNLMPVTESYTINSTANKAEKIIIANYYTDSADITIHSYKFSPVTFPKENYILKVNNVEIIIPPCQKYVQKVNFHNLHLAPEEKCYLELSTNETDYWIYLMVEGLLTNPDNLILFMPDGLKTPGKINIAIQ